MPDVFEREGTSGQRFERKALAGPAEEIDGFDQVLRRAALAQLEVGYAKRQPGQIKRTRFRVSKNGNGYDLVVASQEPLR